MAALSHSEVNVIFSKLGFLPHLPTWKPFSILVMFLEKTSCEISAILFSCQTMFLCRFWDYIRLSLHFLFMNKNTSKDSCLPDSLDCSVTALADYWEMSVVTAFILVST